MDRTPTSITYTGPLGADAGATVQLSANLIQATSGSPAPLAGAPITFFVGTQVCSATTDAAGHAVCSVTLDQPDRDRLAFDHGEILRRALENARQLLESTTVAADFCPRKFTISDLRKVYEAIWGVRLNPQNFQHKVRQVKGFVIPTHERQDGRLGRPAELFRRGPAQILDPPMLRPRSRTNHHRALTSNVTARPIS